MAKSVSASAILSLVLCAPACAQVKATLATNDVALDLSAGPHAPALTRVAQPAGQAWRNNATEDLLPFIEINKGPHTLHWQLNASASSETAEQIVFVYESTAPRLRLKWSWVARASFGPVEHTVEIANLSDKEVWLPMQDSFRFSIPSASSQRLRNVYVDKGAGKPSEIGTHRDDMPVGYRWSGFSSTYAQLFRDQPREIIPWFSIQNANPAAAGWYVGVEFSGRVALRCERTRDSVGGTVGLNPEPGHSFRTRLKPGESFFTPTVFIGAYKGGLDGMGNVLRPWVRQVLGNPQAWRDPQYPLLVNNSWGSGMHIDEDLAVSLMRDSAQLGTEMFHIDAGWFRGVGDWQPDPRKFPRGLTFIADLAHRHGLRFGIWVDWTQAGVDRQPGALDISDPQVHDWTVSDLPSNWHPQEFKGQTIDIGVPGAREYARRELARLVDEYHLDMLEHDGYLLAQGCVRSDHPHAPPDPGKLQIFSRDGNNAVESSNSTDVSYHAVRAYYDLYSQLRREHPKLLLEICNDGGRMVDFGSAAHGDYFSITDTYNPLANRQAFYDASHLLPPAMLEAYVEDWSVPGLEHVRYMLRSGMMGWLTLMLNPSKWILDVRMAARAEMTLYKQQLRPLIRDADLYHVSPRPDGVHWDGVEYFDPKKRKGVLYAFHGSDSQQKTHVYSLKGLDSDQRYRMHFQDGSSPDRVASGRDLMQPGIAVTLPIPLSSELIFFEAASGAQ